MSNCRICGRQVKGDEAGKIVGDQALCSHCALRSEKATAAKGNDGTHAPSVAVMDSTAGNNLAVVGFVLAILGLFAILSAWMGLLGFCGLLVSITALKPVARHRLAVAGTLVSLLGLILPALILKLISQPYVPLTITFRQEAAGNERAMIRACIAYAKNHKGRFPPSLTVLVAQGEIPPKYLIYPFSRESAADLSNFRFSQHPTSDELYQMSQLLRDHCDYVYAGAGFSENASGSDIVIYERPGRNYGLGQTIGFGDASAQWIPWDKMPEVFRKANALRRQKGLEPLKWPAKTSAPSAEPTDHANGG